MTNRRCNISSMKKAGIGRRILWTFALALIVGAVFGSTASPAAAQNQDIAAIDLEQLRSVNGASTVPFEVTVVSDRAIEGMLQVRASEQGVTFDFPLALAANTEISQLVQIPVEDSFIGDVTADLIVDGTSVGEDDLFVGGDDSGTEFVAGVLGLEVTVAQAQVSPPVGMVTNIEIDDLRILSSLDIVLASPAALRTLTVEEQSQLFTWVGAGGQLAVADGAGTIDELLPTPWRGGGSTVVAGVGEINFVGTDWDEVIPPPVSAGSSGTLLGDFGTTGRALASDAGFRVLSISLLVLVLIGYLIVVGPVTFAVLAKMNRQTLAWLAIPVLAVVFGVLIIGTGRILNAGRNDAYASIVTVTPAGSQISSTLLIADDGTQTVELPPGWSARGNGVRFDSFGGGGPGSDLAISPSRTTTELEFEIDAGSAAVVRVEGRTSDADLPFAFADLEIANGSLTGNVTNQSGVDLSDAAVFVGSNATYFEQISDGETLSFDVDMTEPDRLIFPETDEWDVRVDFRFGFDERDFEEQDEGAVNGAAWMGWRNDNFGAAVPEGVITATGWSRGLDEYSLVGGRGRTALVQHAELPTSTEVVSGQIRRTTPRPASFVDIEGFNRQFGEGVPSQYIRPEGSSTDGLAIETSAQLEELAVWVDDEWRYLDLQNNAGARSLSIPEEAWIDDRLTAIFGYGGFGFNGDGQAFQPKIVAADEDSGVAELLPAGERSTRPAEFDDEPELGFDGRLGPEFIGEAVTIGRESREDFNFGSDGLLDSTYDTWTVVLEPGDQVTATMRSDPIDSLLIVTNEDGDIIEENDDRPNIGLDSRVNFRVDDWGAYTFETRSLSGFDFGDYTFDLEVEASDIEPFTWVAEGTLDVDEMDEWLVAVSAGDTVTVAITSDVVPTVTLTDPDGVEVLDTNADASFVADIDGIYTIVVDGIPEGPGSYEFEVSVEGDS